LTLSLLPPAQPGAFGVKPAHHAIRGWRALPDHRLLSCGEDAGLRTRTAETEIALFKPNSSTVLARGVEGSAVQERADAASDSYQFCRSTCVDAMLNYRACPDHFDELLLTMTLSSIALPAKWIEI
jgi:hypothetical protein